MATVMGVTSTEPELYAVVPAGGSGTRLWPLSRANHPKFLQPLTGTPKSLLQATFDRLVPLVGANRITVVTGTAHAAPVARQLPELLDENIVVEPAPRDSCAAIGLAAAIIEHRHPGAMMASFAADHLIRDEDTFRRTVREACAGAAESRLMTIGITPTRAETGYGYVECSERAQLSTLQSVLKFHEKPPLEVATEYVSSGRFLWNASMFVWRTDVFLDALNRYRPDIAEPLREIARAWDRPDRESVLGAIWPEIPRIAIEYAVMEPAATDGQVGTVPGDFGWSDIGDFDTVAALFGEKDGESLVVMPAEARGGYVGLDSDGLVVLPAAGRLVAAVDVHNLIVVDTDDAVLVCNRNRAQDIKKLTELIRQRGAADFV
jgi:mannose-1-phosphate guanylyltransferase